MWFLTLYVKGDRTHKTIGFRTPAAEVVSYLGLFIVKLFTVFI